MRIFILNTIFIRKNPVSWRILRLILWVVHVETTYLDLGLLGESRGSLLIGRILTPFGELTVSCTYRRLLGFGRPSNTPSFRYKTSSRRDIATHLRRQRPHSECSNSPGTLPPPNYKYSGSPSSVSQFSEISSPQILISPKIRFLGNSICRKKSFSL